MRKWICVGILGGLLEFGIVYQIAFSGPDPSPRQTVNTGQTETRTKSTSRARAAVRSGQTAAPEKPTPGSPEAAAVSAVPAVALGAITAVPTTLAGTTPGPTQGDVPGPPASQVKIELAEVLPVPGASPEPVKVPVPVPADLSSLPVEELIRTVFGPEGEKAVQVARCESTMSPDAKKGQFLGLFQMGVNERGEYGHGKDPLAQVLAAHALFLDRGWQPWTCA